MDGEALREEFPATVLAGPQCLILKEAHSTLIVLLQRRFLPKQGVLERLRRLRDPSPLMWQLFLLLLLPLLLAGSNMRIEAEGHLLLTAT